MVFFKKTHVRNVFRNVALQKNKKKIPLYIGGANDIGELIFSDLKVLSYYSQRVSISLTATI